MKTIKFLFLAMSILLSSVVYAQNIDVNKSSLKWTGKKIGSSHYGKILLKEGNLLVKNNTIESGSFVIDMNSINNEDMEDAEYNKKLVGHLKSDDFFGVANFPTANLVISKASNFLEGKAVVEAMLTIKGKTHPISFEVSKNGMTYTATLVVDRSK